MEFILSLLSFQTYEKREEGEDHRLLGGSQSLFGLIGELDKDKTLLTTVSLIGALLVFDTFLELLEHFANDAGYRGLLQKLYKEMMVMGFISFSVFMVFNSPINVSHDENYLSFEFSHILLFFLAFFFVLRAALAVKFTRMAKGYFRRAQNTTATHLCRKFINFAKKPYSIEALVYRYAPFLSPTEQALNYHLLGKFFFKEFPLYQEEFSFVDYLCKSFKFYTIEMVEIEPRSWLFLVILLIVNYVRLAFISGVRSHDICYSYHHPSSKYYTNSSYHGNSSNSNSSYHLRQLAESGGDAPAVMRTCPDYIMRYALLLGFLLVLATTVVCALTSVQMKRLLSLGGVSTKRDRVKKLREFLQEDESVEEFELAYEELLSTLELKKRKKFNRRGAETSVESQLEMGQQSKRRGVPRRSMQYAVSCRKLPTFDQHTPSLRLRGLGSGFETKTYHVSTLVVALGELRREELEHHDHVARKTFFWFKTLCFLGLWNVFFVKKYSERSAVHEKLVSLAHSLKNGSSAGDAPPHPEKESEHHHDSKSHKKKLIHPLLKENNKIFIFKNRELYKYFIQLILMLDAFYLSMYPTNLLPISVDSENPYAYNFLICLTILAMSVLVSYLLISSSILFCLTSLNNHGSDWMCEQDDIKRRVLPILRDEMSSFLGNHLDYADQLFSSISGKDGEISISDFSIFLRTLDLHLSQKEIRALFRAVDVNSSGGIDVDELKSLLFSPHKSLKIHLSFSEFDVPPDTESPFSKSKLQLDEDSNSSTHSNSIISAPKMSPPQANKSQLLKSSSLPLSFNLPVTSPQESSLTDKQQDKVSSSLTVMQLDKESEVHPDKESVASNNSRDGTKMESLETPRRGKIIKMTSF